MKRSCWLFILCLVFNLTLGADQVDLSGVDMRAFISALAAKPDTAEFPAPEETEDAAERPVFDPFPLALVLENVRSGKAEWGPQWPREMPPDAFKVFSGDVRALSVEISPEMFSFRLNNRGLAEALPLWVKGALTQGEISYDENARISLIQTPRWKAEILEYLEDDPSLIRIKLGDGYYFAALRYSPAGISEAWYDVQGEVLGLFEYRLFDEVDGSRITSFSGHYLSFSAREAEQAGQAEPEINETALTVFRNSWGCISEIDGDEGRYQASYYDESLPRYWERSGPLGRERYSLQWDEKGFLVRIQARIDRETDSGDQEETPPEELDYRYEYTLDERGNWITARETAMKTVWDALVPAGERIISRYIEYRTEQ